MIHAGSRPDLGTLDQRFSCVPVMSVGETDEAKSWQGERGFVHACMRRRLKGQCSESEFYLAGPPPMVDAVRRLLVLEEHVAVERIHYDRLFSCILVASRP
jgi:toluene monooxygenase electron transfer component